MRATKLTVDQGPRDDAAVSLESSDVAGLFTDLIAAATYAQMLKSSATAGGALLRGFADAGGVGLVLQGWADAADTTKTTASTALTSAWGVVDDAAGGIGSVGADGNLFAVRKDINGTVVMIVDEDGDIFYSGADDGTISDDFDDVELLTGLRAVMAAEGTPARARFAKSIPEVEDRLVERRVLTKRRAEGGFVSGRGLNQLVIDTLNQLAGRIAALEAENRALRGNA